MNTDSTPALGDDGMLSDWENVDASHARELTSRAYGRTTKSRLLECLHLVRDAALSGSYFVLVREGIAPIAVRDILRGYGYEVQAVVRDGEDMVRIRWIDVDEMRRMPLRARLRWAWRVLTGG